MISIFNNKKKKKRFVLVTLKQIVQILYKLNAKRKKEK